MDVALRSYLFLALHSTTVSSVMLCYYFDLKSSNRALVLLALKKFLSNNFVSEDILYEPIFRRKYVVLCSILNREQRYTGLKHTTQYIVKNNQLDCR